MSFITKIVGGFLGMSAAKKQKKQLAISAAADRENQRVQQKRANLETQRERLKQLREGRIKRAAIIQSGVNAGAREGGTSGITGATGSVTSKVSQNLGSLSVFQGFSERISQLNQISADAISKFRLIGAKQKQTQALLDIGGGIGDAGLSFFGGFSGAGAAAAGGSGASILGGQASASGSIFGGASDRRLKKEIKKIGKHNTGLDLYEWTYIWGEKSIGVMADELKKIKPEAVYTVRGFDYVDYGKIGGRT